MKRQIPKLVVPLRPKKRVNLRAEVAKELGISPEHVERVRILRRSVDARRKDRIRIVYAVEVETVAPDPALPSEIESSSVEPVWVSSGERGIGSQPVVVGTGPAGLFAALGLCLKGYRPILLERGRTLAIRIEKTRNFWNTGELDPQANVQFGEGGAGTFSDGKLTSRSKHPLVDMVFDVFVRCGAPEEILYEKKPHVGTDKIRAVVRRLRNWIIALGGAVHFETSVDGLLVRDGRIGGVTTGGSSVETDAVFFATGHSARDTVEMLSRTGVALEAKSFAVGLRIEHLQERIDRAQYGRYAGHPELGPADYRLSWTDRRAGRSVYTFCNCPGGRIVAAASEPGGVVTNGMSTYRRDSGFSNAGIVVSVGPEDYGSDDALAGVAYQRRIERAAFDAGGANYVAPAQKTRSFLQGRIDRELSASYRPGIRPADIGRVLPESLVPSLQRAVRAFRLRVRDFDDSILVAPETRTSSPVRITRDRDTMESVSLKGFFPLGEGAGYAGGIVSSAVDGLRAVSRIRPFRS